MEECFKCNEKTSTVVKLIKCGHIICCKCLCDYLVIINSAKILCPFSGCSKIISDSVIRKFLSNAQLEFYNAKCFSPNTIKCIVKDCPSFVSFEDKEGHYVCSICGQPNCVTCGRLHDRDVHCKFVKEGDLEQYKEAAKKNLQIHRYNEMKSISENHDLIPNSDAFECGICYNFILPRDGVALRNCLHSFCESCLLNNYKVAKSLNDLSCCLPDCSLPLTEKESLVFIDRDKLKKFCLDVVTPMFFNCQTPSCVGIWDPSSFTEKFGCPVCKAVHCMACRDIHEGMSCFAFRQLPQYKDTANCRKRLNETEHINCHKCQTAIVKKGGCNALRCPSCKLQVCAFSGMEIGPQGCKCSKSKRCHELCGIGCIPDGNTIYEQGLKRYFNDN